MRVLHFLTVGVYPMRGGMEISVLRIAKALTVPGKCRAVIYTRKQAADCLAADSAYGPVEVVHLGVAKQFLLEPLEETNTASDMLPSARQIESPRMDHLLLTAAIQERMDAEPESRHLLISFFVTPDGFVAQHAAFTLGIPHIASVQGSDFSRDFRNPLRIQAIRFVVENADLTVTNNCTQARMLAAAFPAGRAFRTIHNALEEEMNGPVWAPSNPSALRLAADCEFSFKKGTHVLLRAVAELSRQGEPVLLTLAGGMAKQEKEYWEKCQREYLESYPAVFCFPGWLSSGELDELFLSSDVYVSASLGEGCSLSHSRAMALGIPMVATRTGALPELCGQASHVRMCAAASVDALVAAIRGMMNGLRAGEVKVDEQLVRQWRAHFSPERERRQWEEGISQIS